MFDLNRSQREIQKAAKDFAKGEFDHPLSLEFEENRQFPKKIWEKSADLGFIGIQFPEDHSGGGMGILDASLIAESFCCVDSSLGIALTFAGIGSEAISRFADARLKQKILPDICEGNLLSGIAFSESMHGLDITSINTSAAFTKDAIVINGEKTHVANRGTHGGYLVLCRTGMKEETPSTALSLIWVEGDQKGVSFKDAGPKFSTNMMKSAQIHFENVTIPASNLVGKAGNGLVQLDAFYNEIKIIMAAQALGIAQGALERSVRYIKQRSQFNKKIAQFQITRHKIAQMATKIELARLITYKAANAFDNGHIDTALISMAKMTAGRAAVEIADEAIQLFGGYGYMKESEVERSFRDAKSTELNFGGPTAQMDIIADSIIGRGK